MTPFLWLKYASPRSFSAKYHLDLDESLAKNHPRGADDEKFIIA